MTLPRYILYTWTGDELTIPAGNRRRMFYTQADAHRAGERSTYEWFRVFDVRLGRFV